MSDGLPRSAPYEHRLDCAPTWPTNLSDDQVSVPTEPLETKELSTPSMLRQLYGDADGSLGIRDKTRARLKALGLAISDEAPMSRACPCVIPGHDHQAGVNFTKFSRAGSSAGGCWRYYCNGLDHGVGLGEVRAFIAYGGRRTVSPLEAARWGELLDFEARLRHPVHLDLELPDGGPPHAPVVASRMALFVGLRDARFPPTEPFVFARPFAAAYCHLTEDQVRTSIEWLERAQVTQRVGMNGLSILWKLAAQEKWRDRGGA